MVSKACKSGAERSQKMCSARNLQLRQFSMMSSPYGVSTTTPCDSQRIAACRGGQMACDGSSESQASPCSALFRPPTLGYAAITARCDNPSETAATLRWLSILIVATIEAFLQIHSSRTFRAHTQQVQRSQPVVTKDPNPFSPAVYAGMR